MLRSRDSEALRDAFARHNAQELSERRLTTGDVLTTPLLPSFSLPLTELFRP